MLGNSGAKTKIFCKYHAIRLTPNLIDYVIVHELSHLIEMNHSPAFWAIVSAVLPNVKQLRSTLKQCNFILQQFREIPID